MRAGGLARARDWLGRALALARPAEPRTRVSGRAVAADACLAVAATVAALATARSGSGVAAAVATTVPLAARRLAPLGTFWVVLAAAMTFGGGNTAVTIGAVMFAAYCAVVYSRFRGLALLSPPLAGVIVSVAFQDTTPPLPSRFTALVILVTVMLFGNAVYIWRRRARDSQARIGRLQSEHEAQTQRAVELERARIASELHDVVTHNVSVMVVQAGAARQVLPRSPGEAREALLAVEASGRAALTELRHLLGLLAPAGGPPAGASPAAGEPPAPQPGLDRLRPLVGQVAAAGLPVELHVSGPPRPLPPGLDLAAYRVVQEALTNVVKHASQAKTTVRIDYRPGEIVIDVTDDGAAGTAANPGSAAPDPGAVPASASTGAAPGRGLLGLRERVALYGGDLDAGRRPGGGWRVRARLRDGALPAQPAGPGLAPPATPP